MDKIKNDFYGDAISDLKLKDPFKYRGKGRPRKIDYSTFACIQKKYNQKFNEYLNLKIKRLWMN